MGVHAGVDTHALDSADHLSHLALVDRSKTGEIGVADHARGGCEVLNQREILRGDVRVETRLGGNW